MGELAARGLFLGYAEGMASPANAAPGPSFFTGRAKWLWIALAGALGLWLIVLLVIADEPAISETEAPKSPHEQAAGSNVPGFDGRAAKALSQRRRLRASRSSPAMPFPVHDGVDHGQGE